jgi:hypothetical protein
MLYQPVTLLNIAYKIFTILLNNWLFEIIQGKLSDVRKSFRLNINVPLIIYL